MRHITINNRKLPFRATFRALRDFQLETKVSIEGMANLNLDQIARASVHCINAGYRHDKEETRITLDELLDLLDEDSNGLVQLTEALEHDETDPNAKGATPAKKN